MLFSLVLATYGRSVEISELFESLVNQTIGADNFEVILIDQNDVIDLRQIVDYYQRTLKITHIISDMKGLSLNRNVGLEISKGQYLCFPDDDCIYYPDTLKTAFRHLEDSKSQLILGAIRDRGTGRDILKKWPLNETTVTHWNMQGYATSITIFVKNNSMRFCEELGAGTWNGACEDLDYLYKSISTWGNATYYPNLEVWHPSPEISEISPLKVASYGRGFGMFCRMNTPSFPILFMFSLTLIYHAVQCLVELLRFNFTGAKNRYIAFSSRLSSFILATPDKRT